MRIGRGPEPLGSSAGAREPGVRSQEVTKTFCGLGGTCTLVPFLCFARRRWTQFVEPAGLGSRSARLMSMCYRPGSTAYSRLGAFCQVPELTSRRSDTASIRFSSESHPYLKSAHVTLTCVAPRAFSRSSVRLSGNRFISTSCKIPRSRVSPTSPPPARRT